MYDSQLVETEKRVTRLIQLRSRVQALPWSESRDLNDEMIRRQIVYLKQQVETLWRMRAAAIRERPEDKPPTEVYFAGVNSTKGQQQASDIPVA
jgi:hypothetical protein